ncbi:MAG TPA: FGGY-family carbohydrate kinase [Vicinamibacteria bacterium]|nr:FGGY-family carbohydrate kinase [Vicinamibacteria bacterium]
MRARHPDPLFVAVDLGAGSGRVFLAGASPGELLLEEVRRFTYPPREVAGHLRWDVARIFREIDAGLRAAGERARELGRPVQSIGVDSWGVDYGLLDGEGRLLEDPVCYRDARTAGVPARVFARVPRAEIFGRTGIQFLDFNTLFQLDAHAREGLPAQARRLLMMPDLVNHRLTGRAVTEYTNATTTQLVNAEGGDWDRGLVARLDLPGHLLGEIVPAGTDLGPLAPERARELTLDGVHVIAPATHDTGSAVAGAPLAESWAYISSGTWSLVGIERAAPLVNADVSRANFTNEGGAYGTIRFLKNVMGLWILEQCRKEWEEEGSGDSYDRLLSVVTAIDRSPGLIFPDDPRLLNPPRMTAALDEQMRETGQAAPTTAAAMAKVVLDSLALRYASVVRTIEVLTGQTIAGLQIVGGGGRNDYLNQATADATGRPVVAGPVEATVIGNVLVQAVTARRFASLADARRHVGDRIQPRRFEPRSPSAGADVARRYGELEARYLAVRT